MRKNWTRKWRIGLCYILCHSSVLQYTKNPQEFEKQKLNCLLGRSAATIRWQNNYQTKYILKYLLLCVAQKEDFSAFILTEDSQERSNCCVQEVLIAPEKSVWLLLCPSACSATCALSCLSSSLLNYCALDRRAPQQDKPKEAHLRQLLHSLESLGEFGKLCKWQA